MPKMTPLVLVITMLTGAPSAQQRTYYDAHGNVVGRLDRKIDMLSKIALGEIA